MTLFSPVRATTLVTPVMAMRLGKLAKLHASGFLPEVWVADEDTEVLRRRAAEPGSPYSIPCDPNKSSAGRQSSANSAIDLPWPSGKPVVASCVEFRDRQSAGSKPQGANSMRELIPRYIQIANEFALLVAARINQLGTP